MCLFIFGFLEPTHSTTFSVLFQKALSNLGAILGPPETKNLFIYNIYARLLLCLSSIAIYIRSTSIYLPLGPDLYHLFLQILFYHTFLCTSPNTTHPDRIRPSAYTCSILLRVSYQPSPDQPGFRSCTGGGSETGGLRRSSGLRG